MICTDEAPPGALEAGTFVAFGSTSRPGDRLTSRRVRFSTQVKLGQHSKQAVPTKPTSCSARAITGRSAFPSPGGTCGSCSPHL
jgi:hypothetical protein